METLATQTVGQIAVTLPDSTRLFEKVGIDYCCGGHRSLEEACRHAGVAFEDVSRSLDEIRARNGSAAADDWASLSLTEMSRRVCEVFHVPTNEELVRLQALLDKVCGVHGQNHPELLRIREIFMALEADMKPHMMKEEQILFPYLEQMESAVASGETPLPPFFGTVRNPVRMMMVEHDVVGDLLKEIRDTSGNFALPEEACMSYQTLYRALEAFERLTHQHIHVENNLMFPRSVEMEEKHVGQSAW
jgi:regulator of cell morphogenesis and NO signaling